MPSNDISNLFRQFGGDPAQYQEIGRSNEAESARARWSLLARLDTEAAELPPAVAGDGPLQASAPEFKPVLAPAPRQVHTPTETPVASVVTPVALGASAPVGSPISVEAAAAPLPSPEAEPAAPIKPQRAADLSAVVPALSPVPAPAPAPAPAVLPSAVARQAASAPASGSLAELFARLSAPPVPPVPVRDPAVRSSFLQRLIRP